MVKKRIFSMKSELKQSLESDIESIEEALREYLSAADEDYQVLFDSMLYSVQAGGKRVRPFLTMEFCALFGGKRYAAVPFACAVEMVHTYSLIHDDLPCMDDDDLRRGKPTNHIMFGESTALLAGDALLTEAFSLISSLEKSEKSVVPAIRLLADSAGKFGMIGGQQMDLIGEEKKYGLDLLIKMHNKKTGALITCACLLGAIAAGFYENSAEYRAAQAYAEAVGLAFQITDDILDIYGAEADLGKPIGSDAYNGKTTFLSLMSREEAHAYAKRVTDHAKQAIAAFPNNDILCDFADYLLDRVK